MPKALRLVLLAAGGLLALLVAVIAAAWFLMPRDWIDKEARKIASGIPGATLRWNRLEPGLSGFSLGVRIQGLYWRQPADGQGGARVEASVREVFVRFKLLPLLARRVEVAAARITGAGVAMTDRGPVPEPPPSAPGAGSPGVAIVLPLLELNGIDVRSRDRLGGGTDIRSITGTVELGGTVAAPRSAAVNVRAESLLWKPSSKEALVRIPSPLTVQLIAEGREGGKRLEVTRGAIGLGPLKSDVKGSVLLPGGSVPPSLDLTVTGNPQAIRSDDEAFRPLAAKSPAKWSTTASWNVKIQGAATAPVQVGRAVLKPLHIESGPNSFDLDQVLADWTTSSDKTYSARVKGGGAGVDLALDAKGSTEPGGASDGTLVVRAPAARLNGLVPNAPTWKGGDLACKANFSIRPPAPPSVRWEVRGTGMSGTVPGLAKPLSRLDFNLTGDEQVANVNSLQATVGSTTAMVKGVVHQGKPLGTGSFQVAIDKLIAEEWAPPAGSGGAKAAAPAAPAGAPPPIPFSKFDGSVAIGELHSGKLVVRDVIVPVRYEGGTLTASPIRGGIGTGSVTGEATLKNLATAEPSYAIHLDVKRAPVQDLASGLIPFQIGIGGYASSLIDLSGPGLPGAATVTNQLQGAITGTVEDGKLLETPVVTGLRSALGLGSVETNPSALALKTLTHSLRIDAGRLLLDKVKGELGKDLFEMTGSMGLDKSLNLDLLLRLAPERIQGKSALAQFAKYARDDKGRLPVHVKVGGNALKPTFSVKPQSLIQGAGQKLQQELVKQITESTKPKTQKTGKQTDSTATDSTAAAQDPVKQGREALERLLKK